MLTNRNDVASLFLDTIRPLKPFYSEGHAFLHVGNTGVHYGEKSARMEGFARILWGLGPLWSADNSSLSKDLQEEIEEWCSLYRDGILHGTDPAHEEYWADIFDFDQKMVEVAAIVYSIALNPKLLWWDFKEEEQHQIYAWLNQINDFDMPKNNWRFFRILTNMTFQLLGLPWSQDKMDEDFDFIDNFYMGDGWYCDGSENQIDYYVAFAIHFYGLIYAEFMKEKDEKRSRMLKERSTAFYPDFVYWFANDGNEVPFGRSLTYRYAHSSPLGAMAFANLDVNYGVLKNLVLGNLETWMKRPIFDNAGVLSIGYGYPQNGMSEDYNGCGSPYWCNKAFVVLALNDDHPFWSAERKMYPYEERKLLKYPHMLVTHDEHDHVMAYVVGQHLDHDHGQGAAKYEKFVYSNQFGFSVTRGDSLEHGAFDNTLAVSVKGENRYCMCHGAERFDFNEKMLCTKYRPLTGVEVETTLVPCNKWHVRIHRIKNTVPIDIADGGFALPQEQCFTLQSGRKTGRFEMNDVKIKDAAMEVQFPWVSACMVSETGLTPELVTVSPNTNLYANLTVIPTVKTTLEKGVHCVVTSIAADFYDTSATLLENKPVVMIQDGKVTIKDKKGNVIFSEGDKSC